MKTFTRSVALVIALGAVAPMAAQAAPLLTPHAKIVQEINHSYGTQFKVPNQSSGQASQTRG